MPPHFIMHSDDLIVLQERVTLDDAVLSASTFPNGCDWAFYFEPDGNVYMGYGCYGVMINLVTGKRKLLYKWFIDQAKPDSDVTNARVRLPIHAETIRELKSREPCKICGQPYFRNVGDEPSRSSIHSGTSRSWRGLYR